MEVFDVVMKLNGPIEPVGDTGLDAHRLENLKALCDLTSLLLDRITAITERRDDHMASIKEAKSYAIGFLAAAGVKTVDGGQR